MAEIDRSVLFSKLNGTCYSSVEGATTLCKLRGNRYVEIAHWLHQLSNEQDSDFHHILNHFEIEPGRLVADTTRFLDGLPRGASSISDFSDDLLESIEKAWTYTSLCFGESKIRSGHWLLCLLSTPHLKRALFSISPLYKQISAESLLTDFNTIVEASPETSFVSSEESLTSGDPSGSALGAGPGGASEALHRFTQNLTQAVRDGKSDPIVGRDDEVRQIVDVLMRRRQNNPILTGEAGVGKTAVVESLAQKIVEGDVPPQFRDVDILSLDVGLLQAGASMKGEFESRLRSVVEAVQSSEKPIILFIDEAHTLIGAGGDAGTGDAANLLKPALARGELRTIAATTWAEYKQFIEKDPALTRRFQVVKVEEPDVSKGVRMMRGIARVMEKHHKVQILDDALIAAVELSHRYIPARQLPDKAVSLLDTAAARVAISQHAVPPSLDNCRKDIQCFETELEILSREAATGHDVGAKLDELNHRLNSLREEEAQLESRWKSEKTLVEKLLSLRQQLSQQDGKSENSVTDVERSIVSATVEDAKSQEAILSEIDATNRELSELQGDDPFVLPAVDQSAVGSVVQDWTGIPVGRMVKDELETIIKLPEVMEQRIIGQRHALEVIAKRIQTSRANLDNPQKPIGVFMLAGTSGVGKTETALTLAETLYGGEQNLITINMSEFQEAHTVSTLKGAPPGYVGYGEGGVLTEAVRRRPYSVVLLDEIEKAHPDVHEIFFQVFDKGWMEDGEGRAIDFKNTVIILTTNVGTDVITDMCRSSDSVPEVSAIEVALKKPMLEVFPAALLGRLVMVPYYPLSDDMVGRICRLQLDRVQKRIRNNHDITLTYSDAVVDQIVSRCQSVESGGRMIDTILTNTMLPAISMEILSRAGSENTLSSVGVDVSAGEFCYEYA